MSLHRHVRHSKDTGILVNPLVDGQLEELPRFRLPEREISQDAAYQLVHDELMLDGNPRLNLATFLTTWMEPKAQALITECLNKNLVNKDEYPQAAEIERRCVNIIAGVVARPRRGHRHRVFDHWL